jgi:hypothetical protein
MQLNTDLHYQYALDRQQRLRAEAEAHRLAGVTPVRTRAARFLLWAADRFDAAIARRRCRDSLPERG